MNASTSTNESMVRSNTWSQVGLLLALAFLLGLYVWLRFGGALGHGDTASFSEAIWAILDSGTLIPEVDAYPNGYGYQALVIWLSAFTGLSLASLQLLGSVLLVFWVVLPAWLAYREFTRSEVAAFLATLMLIVQPEFLFPLFRGTHEKFTRGLMFLLLFLFLHSLRAKSVRAVASLVAAFYLSAYALITFNSLMAMSFMAAIGLALVLIWGVRRHPPMAVGRQSLLRRLWMIVPSLLAIAFIFIFYAYPPAQKQLDLLQSIGDRLAVTFLQVEEVPVSPYDVVAQGWVSLPVYILVSLANWILLAGCAAIWLWQGWRWFFQRKEPEMPNLLLWSFCGAFAVQSAGSVLVDLSGAIAGNLQHRLFPSFSMLAAPVVAEWIVTQRRRLASLRRGWLDRSLGVLLGVLLLLAVIKASNEPLLSNYWTFYTTTEHAAVRWAERALAHRSLWIGFNGRVSSGYKVSQGGRVLPLFLDMSLPASSETRDFLVSQVNLLHGARLSVQLPSALRLETNTFVTYANGEAEIFHSRPRSLFQR